MGAGTGWERDREERWGGKDTVGGGQEQPEPVRSQRGGQWFRVDVVQGRRVGEWTDLTFGCRKVGPRTGVVWA